MKWYFFRKMTPSISCISCPYCPKIKGLVWGRKMDQKAPKMNHRAVKFNFEAAL